MPPASPSTIRTAAPSTGSPGPRPTSRATVSTRASAIAAGASGRAPWTTASPRHTAALYRVDPDRSVHKAFGEVGISNCFAWSPENDTFYFADSLDKRIYRFDYDHDSGTLANRRLFAETAGANPDGGAIDEHGYLWNAEWDAWRVVRYAPDGTVERIVALPVQKPTSCMFGGPDLTTLYITSAVWDLTPADLKNQPQAGGLFAIDTGIRGLPEPRFAG